MNFKLSDTQIITLLVVALVTQILLLLWHLEIIHFQTNSIHDQNKEVAGIVKLIENNLKRRPLDSLIWEDSTAPSKVYFYDSVLTLSESTAKIELDNGTQISLSENTLITIEPPDTENSKEIRIQFSQGNLKTRNPYQKTTIQDKSISIKLTKNSDIEVFKSEDGQYEVLLNEGQAELNRGKQSIALSENEILAIKEETIKKTKIDTALVWDDLKLQRIYSFSEKANFSLRWKGIASQLLVFKEGEVTQKIALQHKQSEIQLELPLGEYRLALANGDNQSLRLPIQVWQARTLQLVTPLPRNREKYGSYEFIWTGDKSFVSYEVEFKNGKHNKRYPSQINKTSIPLEQDMDIFWGVWGVDRQGFKNPPRYYYPLYIRKNPFAPPKLKKPKLIKKKPFRSSWIQWFIPQAHAQKKNEALFSWENIPGADLYFIEISETQDFRNPILKTQTKKNSFAWSVNKSEKTYYWRVAAGNQSGRMGQFTDPTLVEWQIPAAEKSQSIFKPKPKLKKKIIAKKTKPMTIDPNPEPPKPDPKSEPSPLVEKKKTNPPLVGQWELMATPSFTTKNFQENGSTKANLSGVTPLSFSATFTFNVSSRWRLHTLFKVNEEEYEPKPKDQFPFQENLQSQNIYGLFHLQKTETAWGYGLGYLQITDIERVGFEKLTTRTTGAYGPLLFYGAQIGSIESQSRLAVLYDGKRLGGLINQRFIYPLYFDWLLVGTELEAFYLSGSNSQIISYEASLLLGFRF